MTIASSTTKPTAIVRAISERLSRLKPSGSITAAGSVTTLAAGASSSSALTIGLLTGAAGSVSGAAVITLASDGAGTDGDPALSLGSQTIAFTLTAVEPERA